MKRIVFSNMSSKGKLYKMHYPVDGNSDLEYEGEVQFPVNAVLAKTLKADDEVKIYLLTKEYGGSNSEENIKKFKEELREVTKNVITEDRIQYEIIPTPFEETESVHEDLYREMAHKLEEDAHIIGDITYGPKPMAIVMFLVMNFAEKFFHCDIDYIVYGKVEFQKDESQLPQNPMIYDLTPLYYLNSLIDVLDFGVQDTPQKALDSLDAILSIGKDGKD